MIRNETHPSIERCRHLPPAATLLPACLLAALALFGCSGEEPEAENPNAEACEHITETDGAVALTAASTASASAPEIRSDHQRYDVALAASGSGRSGYVAFAVAEAGDYIFFTDAPVQLTVKSPAGADVIAESSAASIPECAEVKGRHVYPLGVGTHVIGVSGSAARVGFVVEGHAAH
jgi:hypothetical protein